VVLNSISGVQSMSGAICLTGIDYKKGKEVTIKGEGLSGPDINNFILELRNTGKFAFVTPQGEYTLGTSPINNQPIYRFTLSCPLKGGDNDKDSTQAGGTHHEE
jgi:hypothetical protein